jgi:predicted GIY-YIG superfamily endonuclease
MPFNQFVPRNFTPDSVEMYAPMTSGVYGISNAREWIYIGETNNIQDSLLTHLQDLQASIQKREPTGFVFEVCDQAHRSARQNRLVLEYGPTCNRPSSGRS